MAARIYNFGLVEFSSDVAFISEYLDFLDRTNDHNNTRIVFEKYFDFDAARLKEREAQLQRLQVCMCIHERVDGRMHECEGV